MAVVDACDVVEVGMLEEGIAVAGVVSHWGSESGRKRSLHGVHERVEGEECEET